MDVPLNLRKIGLYAASIAGLAMAFFAASAVDAEAANASQIACGSIQCNVTSSQYASGTSSSNPPPSTSTGGGSGSGSSSGRPRVTSKFVSCAWWYGLEAGGFRAVSSYPDPEAPGAWRCNFERQASDLNANLPACHKTSDGRIAKGKYDVYRVNDDGSRGALWYSFCTYPTRAYLTPTTYTVKRPTGGQGDFLSVTTDSAATRYGAGGTRTDTTGYRSTGFNPSQPWHDVRLNQTFNARTGLTGNNQPNYSRYRLQWRIDWVDYRQSVYPGWLGKADKWERLRSYSTTQATPYTYACNLNPALQQGLIDGAIYDPAQCQRHTWRCDVQGNPQMMGTSNRITVMRNGERIPVTMPRFEVLGNGVSNVRNKQTFTAVDMKNVSPVNITEARDNPNHAKQYFDASWEWNQWRPYQPNNQWVAFYWSSDTGKSFKFTQRYRFTAEFYVPASTSINGNNSYRWVTGSTECGGVKTSNDAEVVRSAGSE